MGEVAAVKQSSQDIVRYNTDFSQGDFRKFRQLYDGHTDGKGFCSVYYRA